MFKRLFTAAILFGAAATGPPVFAQSQIPCGPRAAIVDILAENRGEAMVAGGYQSSQRIIEIWASDDTGTFTILLTFPSGASCLIGTGTNFNLIQPDPDIDDIPS